MGCGASSNLRVAAIDTVGKPILGATAADVVQGSPVFTESADNVEAEAHRKVCMVQGLVQAAKATVPSNPVAAAGLAMMAASVADSMPAAPEVETASRTASPFAASALASAQAGAETAEASIEAAMSAAIAVAQHRSKMVAGSDPQPTVSMKRDECIVIGKCPGKPASYSQILSSAFRGDF